MPAQLAGLADRCALPENQMLMESPPTDELRTRPMPDAAAALRGAKETILTRWRNGVTDIVRNADELTRRQLEDDIPVLLDRIADALASDAAATDRSIAMFPEHGTARFHQEFSLNLLLIEYELLRRIILQEMAAALRRAPAIDEIIAVSQGIDIAMRTAVVAFAEHQSAALKTETSAMTKFLSFLSHDLRGGLNGAVLMVEVLKRELAGEEKFASAVDDLEVMRRTILDTIATMERFLHAEKLRLGRMPVDLAPVRAAELAAELLRHVTYQLKDQGVEMTVQCDPPELTIQTDRQLLTMILQNLISNGIKYSRHGKVHLSISVPPKVEGQPAVSARLAVSDTGPGIAPEKLNDLFAAFARGETYGQKGIGLGLYIARQAAGLLGARLWAESKLGQGTTFYVDVK